MGIDLTVGVAVFPEDAAEPEALIARADAAMYAGKRLGGGRVVLASELPAEA
jgi:GGDEF domain-containing protein